MQREAKGNNRSRSISAMRSVGAGAPDNEKLQFINYSNKRTSTKAK